MSKNYNTTLQTNNSSLEEIITQLNNMPDADGGLDTSDATAVVSDILNGKTAYVNGEKITGNIPSKAAATYTPKTYNQAISSGTYLTGTQTIIGDINLIASNIKSGVSIFGVAGTYEGTSYSTIYVGTSAPTADIGTNGDIYIVRSE